MYGTCSRSTPEATLNISPAMCSGWPLPPEPKASWPGRAFANSISSRSVLTGTDEFTTTKNTPLVSWLIGAKERIGSYGRVERRLGALASVPVVPRSSV